MHSVRIYIETYFSKAEPKSNERFAQEVKPIRDIDPDMEITYELDGATVPEVDLKGKWFRIYGLVFTSDEFSISDACREVFIVSKRWHHLKVRMIFNDVLIPVSDYSSAECSQAYYNGFVRANIVR